MAYLNKLRSSINARLRKLSIRVKLLLPVIAALAVALLILLARVPPTLNTLVESNVQSVFSGRIEELRFPLGQFLDKVQTDLIALSTSDEVNDFLTAQISADPTDKTVAQSALASRLVGKITQNDLPYVELRYLTIDGQQVARATARSIGGTLSGEITPPNELKPDQNAQILRDNSQWKPARAKLISTGMNQPSPTSGLKPEPVVQIAIPVYQQNTLVGAIVGSLRIHDWLTTIFDQPGKSVQYQTLLVEHDNNVLTVSNPNNTVSVLGDEQLLAPLSLPPSNALNSALTAPQVIGDRIFRTLKLGESATDLPDNDWRIIVSAELNSVYAQAQELTITLTLTLFIIFAIVIFGVGVIGRSLTQPLVQLSQVANQIADGDLTARATVVSEDEVGRVAVALNSMSDRLADLIGTLEHRVSERTRNLEIAADISRDTTQLTNLNELLQRTVDAIYQRFNLKRVQIFLIDEATKTASLAVQASNQSEQQGLTQAEIANASAAGGSTTSALIEKVVSIGQPVTTGTSTGAATSHFLIPLRTGNTIMGVLDIESREGNSLEKDSQIFQTLADQSAIAVNNARLYETSEQARLAADEANRHKSDFLSNMSHELRTPLNVIIGYSHSILNRPAMYENVPLPPVYIPVIESIMKSGQDLFGLISDILDLSKIEAGRIVLDIKPVDVVPILEGVRSTALGLIKPNVQLRVDYPTHLPLVTGDELRIRQVLLNLVSNAAKFTEQGFLTLNAEIQENELSFSVADTGIGIAKELQPFIFNRFQQASNDITRKFGGTGLGLNISQQLITMQKGRIWFESIPGQGTTFFFTLPLAIEQLQEGVPTDSSPARSNFQIQHVDALEILKQVLLVDTFSETRGKLNAVLSGANYAVSAADDPERAITLACGIEPELILIHLHDNDTEQMKNLSEAIRQEPELSNTAVIVLEASKTKKFDGDELTNFVLEQLSKAL